MSKQTNCKRLVMLGKLFLVVLLFTLCSVNISANAKNNDEQIKTACERALGVIQPMNEDKLEIEVRDIYNVLDTEGNLDGYSLGYYVGKEPYGYAIYSIESSSIREFVFYPGVENLYNELEDKAEYYNDVDEDDLINGIVCTIVK